MGGRTASRRATIWRPSLPPPSWSAPPVRSRGLERALEPHDPSLSSSTTSSRKSRRALNGISDVRERCLRSRVRPSEEEADPDHDERQSQGDQRLAALADLRSRRVDQSPDRGEEEAQE